MARRSHKPSNQHLSLETAPTAAMAMLEVTGRQWRQGPQQTFTEGWRFYHTMAEVHYPITVGGNLASKLDLIVEERGPDGWGTSGNRVCGEALEAFENASTEAFFRSHYQNYSITGEGFMLISDDEVGPHPEFVSTSEMSQEPSRPTPEWPYPFRWYRSRRMGEKEWFRGRVIRVWRPSPQFSGDADSAVRSVIQECKELEVLKLSLLAKITSRLASLGILFIPNSITLPAAITGQRDGTDPVVAYFSKLFAAPLTDLGSAAAAQPVLMRGPSEAAEQIRHIVMDTALSDADARHRDELRRTIAQGIELPTQTQTGQADGVNHWGLWSIAETALGDHVAPIARGAARAATTHFLWPWLIAAGWTPQRARRFRFSIDPTRAALSLTRQDAARQAYDRQLLSDAAFRRYHGLSENDAPTVDELIRAIGIKLGNPMLATWGIPVDIPPDALIGMPSMPGPNGYDAPEPQTTVETAPGRQTQRLDES